MANDMQGGGSKKNSQAPGEYSGQQGGVVAPITLNGGGNTDPNLQGMGRGAYWDMQGSGTDTSQYAQAAANEYRYGGDRGPLGPGMQAAAQHAEAAALGGAYEDAARRESEENALLNRPNVQTPYGSTQWVRGPDGTWTLQQGFSGPLAGLNEALQQQAAAMGQPMDWAQFGTMPTGAEARQQAIDAAYGQAESRLNPFWQQRESAERERLLNQGVGEGSEAYRNALGALGRERTDAYQSALNSAIGQGTQAGQAIFSQGLLGRQQAISEALRRRGQPLAELEQMQGLLRQPGYNSVLGPQLTAALQSQQGANADAISGGAQMVGALLPLLLSLGSG